MLRSSQKRTGAHQTWGLIAGTSLLALFGKLSGDLGSQDLNAFDTLVGNFIRSYTSEWLTMLAVMITNMGSAAFEISLLLIAGGYMYFYMKQTREPLMLAVSLAGTWLLNNLLKIIFQRTRPDVLHLVAANGFSFPSGHAMITTAFYGMLGYIIWSHLRQRSKPAWYVMLLTFCLVIAIGVSRVYLGVHYPSDVVAGFAAGGICLLACVLTLRALRRSSG
jgi:undecaprenyl-diphosphatase